MLAAGCGSVNNGEPNEEADAGNVTGDTTPPAVVSISPADGSTGARADAEVVIVFSEPMDQLSVQNSLDTSDLGGVTFAWSNGGATLTITPDNPLEYAEGTGNDPAQTDAKQYTVILGTGATDEAGNPIEAGAQTIFTTLKSMTTTLGRVNALTGAGTPTGVTTDGDDFLYVGDDDLEGTASAYRGYITVDLSALPSTTVEVASATLKGYQLHENADPYGVLGNGTGLLLEHASFTLGSAAADNAAFNSEPLSAVGVFANTGDTDLSIDVTAQVRDDVTNRVARSDRSQYRLRFATFTNLDATANYVLISRDELTLDVVYLAP